PSGSASRELGYDLGHQTLHLLGFVEDWSEEEQLRPGLCHLAQTSHARIGRPVDRERLEVVRLKERIEALQRLAESAARAVGVLVDGDVDAVSSTYRADRLTPPAASIRDEAPRREALTPPRLGPLAACAARQALT